MSINAISSISLYEYYYSINKDEKKKTSPLEREMREYGLTPTDNERLNIAMLEKAKDIQREIDNQSSNTISFSDRPWADVMYQLNLSFNEDPKEDITDIKEELQKLLIGIEDEELNKEITDLEKYVEELYVSFSATYSTSIDTTSTINMQLNNLAMLNRSSLL